MASKKPKQPFPNAIHLTVASVPRAIVFYVEKLGFKLTETFPNAQKPVHANLVLNGQQMMLGELPSLQEAKQFGMDPVEIELLKQDARAFARGTPGIGCACYLLVPDVDAFAKKLKKKRVKLLTPPKTQFYGIRDCQVADHDGYRLVFYSPAEVGAAAPAAED